MFSSSSTPSSDSTLLSPSSSSSSSPPSSSHLKTTKNHQNSSTQTTTTQTQKTMEEVWNDITINSLPTTPISHIHNPTASSTTSHYKGFILQDFLNSSNGPTNLRNSSVDSPPPPPPRTTTTEFQFLDNEFQFQGNPSVPSMISGVAAFDALASSSVLASFAAVNGGSGGGGLDKRVSENGEDGSVDRIRRHKRMIKNRESAARSRARKQAYITELELEVDNFKRENAALRKQQRLLIEAPPARLPKKHGLRRTSTAPF